MFSYFSYLTYFLKIIKKRFPDNEIKDKFKNFQNEIILVCSNSKYKFWKNLHDKNIEEKDYIRNCLKIKKLILFDEPLPYIIKNFNFYSFNFKICKGVFIPQKETEFLVDAIKEISEEIWPEKKRLRVLEIGSGSGIIPICLSLTGKNHWFLESIDINKKALSLSQKNSYFFGIKNTKFFSSNLFSNVSGKYDIIFSNPPYLSKNDFFSSCKRLKKQPKKALISKLRGLDFYCKIVEKIKFFSEKKFAVFFEVGHEQSEFVKSIVLKEFSDSIKIKEFKDFSLFVRVIVFYKL